MRSMKSLVSNLAFIAVLAFATIGTRLAKVEVFSVSESIFIAAFFIVASIEMLSDDICNEFENSIEDGEKP